MRTDEEILEYISENEPTKIDRCPISDRWEKRYWNTGETTIVESYEYENEPTHRILKVTNIIREEVGNE